MQQLVIEYGHLGWYWEKQSVNNTNARVNICSMQPSLVVCSENETIFIRSENHKIRAQERTEKLFQEFEKEILPKYKGEENIKNIDNNRLQIELRPHQKEGMQKWKENGFIGTFANGWLSIRYKNHFELEKQNFIHSHNTRRNNI